jgi:hypothetical protein
MAAFSLKKIGFLTPLAALVLILTLVNVLLNLGNQYLRMELTERQQLINQSIQLEAIYREVVQALANVAVNNNDAELKSLLASQGINLDGAPKPPAGAK